jgi:hypothetical protein
MMWVQTLSRKRWSWLMTNAHPVKPLRNFSSQRIDRMSRWLVGSSNSRMSGLAASTWASSTRSLKPPDSVDIGWRCTAVGISRPSRISPATDSRL